MYLCFAGEKVIKSSISKEELLEEIKSEVKTCTLCSLSQSRTKIVFGEGDPDALLMFVGEAPGEEEDRTGRPFVGKAGQLLTKILQSVGLKREEVYITNIIKCRPPGNRTPAQSEMDSCFPYLEAQIAIINPSIIITLGGTSTLYLLGKKNLSANFGVSGLIGEEEKKSFPCSIPAFSSVIILDNQDLLDI